MMEKLWGDNYFDSIDKVWRKEGQSGEGKPLKRAFCNFIMEPIIRLASSIMLGNIEQMDKILETINLKLTNEDRTKDGK